MVGYGRARRGMEIGIKVYNLLGSTKQGSYTWLDETTNEEVVTKTRYICQETAQVHLHMQMPASPLLSVSPSSTEL